MNTSLQFALPPGASEPREIERWSYDRDTGRVEDAEGRPVLYVASNRMDAADVSGRNGRATRTGLISAAAPDMLEALKGALVAIDTIPRPADLSAELSAALDTRRAAAVAAVAKAEGRTS